MARRSRTLTQGPSGAPPAAPEAGPSPPWWPEWMPWLDFDALRNIFEQYNKFVTEGREPGISREQVGEAARGAGEMFGQLGIKSIETLDEWYKKARKALEGRMK